MAAYSGYKLVILRTQSMKAFQTLLTAIAFCSLTLQGQNASGIRSANLAERIWI